MKNDEIKLRCDLDLKKEIKAQAEKQGLSMSAYLILLHKQNINKDK